MDVVPWMKTMASGRSYVFQQDDAEKNVSDKSFVILKGT